MYIAIFEMPFAAMVVAGLMPRSASNSFALVLSYGTHPNYLCRIFLTKLFRNLYSDCNKFSNFAIPDY